MKFRGKFSLRLLLVVCTLIAVAIAYWDARAKRQQAVTTAVGAVEGRVTYEDPSLPVPSFLVDLLGPDYFCQVKVITLYPTADSTADQQIMLLKDLPDLKRLAIWPGSKGLTMAPTDPPGGLSDAGVDYLLTHFPQLEHLSLLSTQLSETGEKQLMGKTSITSLQYDNHSDFGKRSGGR